MKATIGSGCGGLGFERFGFRIKCASFSNKKTPKYLPGNQRAITGR